jgi:Skp family chaperone for outer membrane proteins
MLTAAALLLATAARGGEDPAKPAAPQAQPLRIAVVDVDKVFAEYKKGGDRYRQIEKKFQPVVAELRREADNIRALQRQMNEVPRDKPLERLKLKQRIEIGMAEITAKEKTTNRSPATPRTTPSTW